MIKTPTVSSRLFVFCIIIVASCTTVPMLDNLAVMGRYTLDNSVFMTVHAVSENQVSIKITSRQKAQCHFSGLGTLQKNSVTIQDNVGNSLNFIFSEQDVRVKSYRFNDACEGRYIKSNP